jgi:hypothetical protein
MAAVLRRLGLGILYFFNWNFLVPLYYFSGEGSPHRVVGESQPRYYTLGLLLTECMGSPEPSSSLRLVSYVLQ